jgi:hypothetical protein
MLAACLDNASRTNTAEEEHTPGSLVQAVLSLLPFSWIGSTRPVIIINPCLPRVLVNVRKILGAKQKRDFWSAM